MQINGVAIPTTYSKQSDLEHRYKWDIKIRTCLLDWTKARAAFNASCRATSWNSLAYSINTIKSGQIHR
jgi:hypothetical protein